MFRRFALAILLVSIFVPIATSSSEVTVDNGVCTIHGGPLRIRTGLLDKSKLEQLCPCERIVGSLTIPLHPASPCNVSFASVTGSVTLVVQPVSSAEPNVRLPVTHIDGNLTLLFAMSKVSVALRNYPSLEALEYVTGTFVLSVMGTPSGVPLAHTYALSSLVSIGRLLLDKTRIVNISFPLLRTVQSQFSISETALETVHAPALSTVGALVAYNNGQLSSLASINSQVAYNAAECTVDGMSSVGLLMPCCKCFYARLNPQACHLSLFSRLFSGFIYIRENNWRCSSLGNLPASPYISEWERNAMEVHVASPFNVQAAYMYPSDLNGTVVAVNVTAIAFSVDGKNQTAYSVMVALDSTTEAHFHTKYPVDVPMSGGALGAVTVLVQFVWYTGQSATHTLLVSQGVSSLAPNVMPETYDFLMVAFNSYQLTAYAATNLAPNNTLRIFINSPDNSVLAEIHECTHITSYTPDEYPRAPKLIDIPEPFQCSFTLDDSFPRNAKIVAEWCNRGESSASYCHTSQLGVYNPPTSHSSRTAVIVGSVMGSLVAVLALVLILGGHHFFCQAVASIRRRPLHTPNPHPALIVDGEGTYTTIRPLITDIESYDVPSSPQGLHTNERVPFLQEEDRDHQ